MGRSRKPSRKPEFEGSQNLRETRDIASEQHNEKSAKSIGLTLVYSLGNGGHPQFDAKLLDAVRRIQKEYQDEYFGINNIRI